MRSRIDRVSTLGSRSKEGVASITIGEISGSIARNEARRTAVRREVRGVDHVM